jgi:flagellar hook protein FlgE
MSSRDGNASGTLLNVAFDASGNIRGTFSNGALQTLGQIMLAEFNNPGGLMRAGDNAYSLSANSGTEVLVQPGESSKLNPGAIEQSNVDLADEFTKMITAQRGFQASARVITTSDEFLQEVVNLKR